MKKILSLLCGSLIILLMFVAPGNPVQAAEGVFYLGPAPDEHPDGDCGCHDLILLSGPEGNKIVSNLLKSEVFKNQKMVLKNEGLKWNGANGIEVIQPTKEITFVGVPFINNEGTTEMHTFFIGDEKYIKEFTTSPKEEL